MGRRASRRPRYKRPLIWVIVITSVLGAVTVICGLLVVQKALSVRDQLEAAVPLASTAQVSMLKGDFEASSRAAQSLVEKTGEARSQTDDFLWWLSEKVPFIGPNTAAIRVAAEAADDFARDVVSPLTQIDFASIQPTDGRFDVEAIATLHPTLSSARESAAGISASLADVKRDQLDDRVDVAFEGLSAQIVSVTTALDSFTDVTAVLPDALGRQGPRNYLLLFQNNAESRGLGGNPASVVLLTVSDGELAITRQASSSDFDNGRMSPIVSLDDETVKLYGTKVGRYMQDMTMTPDFPTVAAIAKAWWADLYGDPIDGVLSFDPVALSYLLEATGPVSLPTGEELSNENAVSFLLNRVYFRYEDPDMQDAVFAGAAVSVFEAVKSGVGDLRALGSALIKATVERRLIYWSANAAESALIADTPIAGRLARDAAVSSQMGVYVNDTTGSKMDYYLSLAVDVDRTCTSTSDVSHAAVTLTSQVNPAEVSALPRYVTGLFYKGGRIATDLVVYAPLGQTASGWAVNGKAVTPQYVGSHLGRSVAKLSVLLAPAESAVVSYSLTGDATSIGVPLEVTHTPMVQGLPVTVNEESCAAR